ncbi:MAG: hypothetical protein HY554_14520 [Elusimicrobia bacterium]|nr:hypothetical protein [Elusimicrobiota bacterium]
MVLALSAAWLLAGPAAALPPYQRMFQAKYKYKANCTACHDRDSWELTGYGKGFFKQGRGLAAFAAIEAADPDGDGASSGQEIAARSNPGDPRSTPQRLGDWLKNLLPPQAPRKHLAALFPGHDRAALEELELGADRRKRIESGLSRPLRDEELYPVFFRVFRGDELLGAALYASAAAPHACSFIVGYAQPKGRPARVTGLRVLDCEPKALKSGAFLDRLRGAGELELGRLAPPAGEAAAAGRAVIDAVLAGARIVEDSSIR